MTIVPERLTAAIVDRYRIERELGQGGMATVYLAHDIRHDRHVALKVLKPELAAVLGGDRFVQEIRTTAALQHPHILPLFDSGVADSFLYYVMPFIDGETLRSKLDRETQLGIDEAVRITVAIADALDYAHRRGIIHRDIKPENILLHEGRPMVADFGIALAVSAAAGGRMTETGLSLGTPHYMSPEQATAEKEISARSDIYSLASVLYEMLTGNPPHVGASAQQIIMKIVTEEAAPVTKLRRSVPPHVAAAVAKALEKLPADRFASANEFGSALTNPAFASAKSPLEGTHAVAKKQRWQRAGLLAAGIVGALLATGMLALLEPPERTDVIRMTIEAPADSAVLSLRYHGDAGTMADPIVSPSGTLIAFTVAKASGPSIYMRSTASFELTEIPGDGKWPFFSPDGGSIGYLRGSEIWTMNLADAAPARAAALTESGWDIGGQSGMPTAASSCWAPTVYGRCPSIRAYRSFCWQPTRPRWKASTS
jgi:eukaryotic-like serine/threonine-protein kinase